MAGTGFGHAGPRSEQDFSGVLSNQMERHETFDAEPSEPASSAAQESAGPPEPERAAVGEGPVREDVSGSRDDTPARPETVREETAPPQDVQGDRQEKAAGEGQDGTDVSRGAVLEQDEADTSAAPVKDFADRAGVDGEVSEEELQEAVADLARRAEGLDRSIPGLAAGIREVQDLVRRFRESAPSERGELGRAIEARIRALYEEMAAARRDGEAVVVRGKGMKVVPGSAMEAGALHNDAATREEAPASTGSSQAKRRTGEHGAASAELRTASDAASKATEDGDASRSALRTAPDSVLARGESAEVYSRAARDEGVPDDQARDAAGAHDATSAGKKASSVSSETAEAGEGRKNVAAIRHGAAEASGREGRERTAGRGAEAHADPEPRDGEAPREARTVHDERGDVLRSREAKAASETASTGLAGRGDAAAEKGRGLSPGQVSVADAGDESGQSGKAAAPAEGNDGRRGDARQGFFSLRDEGRQASDSSRAKTVNTTAGKNAPEAPTPGAGAGQDAQQAVQQRLEGPSNSRSAEVYRQVENGAFRNLGQGVRQLVIRLDPAELGQISVILQVKGKEVQAVLRASNQEASHALGEQMSQLRAHLESQGLRVSRLEVQTQLADSQQQSQWQGAEQHNRFQENRELALSAQRWRNLGRAEGGLVRDVQTVLHREKLSQDGLDIFA
jgi:flagellar hook-length control protein FliK